MKLIITFAKTLQELNFTFILCNQSENFTVSETDHQAAILWGQKKQQLCSPEITPKRRNSSSHSMVV